MLSFRKMFFSSRQSREAIHMPSAQGRDPPANRMALSGHRLPADWHSRAVTGTTNTEVHMNTTRIMAIAALIAATGLALHVAQAQQVGARRIDLQRHDLSVPGREVVQTIVELAPGTTAPRHTHPGEEIIYVLEARGNTRWTASRR
jgi:uncharacterized RmlC-like cupin family protein